jgi:hypothetical protein
MTLFMRITIEYKYRMNMCNEIPKLFHYDYIGFCKEVSVEVDYWRIHEVASGATAPG